MIKFFRKIRQNLLSEGKTGKYLKYAIGEIILVVIGIFIALQLNNWNTNRLLKNEELKLLESLHQEFSENLVVFDDIYKKHLTRKKSIAVLMTSEIEDLHLDSLRALTRNSHNNYTYDPYQGIYRSVINSGKIELISNDSLKQRISKLQDLLVDYKEEETNVMTFVTNNLYPYIIQNRKLNFKKEWNFEEFTEEELAKYKTDIIEMIKADKYENLMVYVYGYMAETFTEGPMLRAEMVFIIESIESEIRLTKK